MWPIKMEPNAKLLCETILQFFERNNSAPLIIGICGPQGTGKATQAHYQDVGRAHYLDE
jgi:pantothenate kinase-related protein Tda10